jgi:hypothetical protein
MQNGDKRFLPNASLHAQKPAPVGAGFQALRPWQAAKGRRLRKAVFLKQALY